MESSAGGPPPGDAEDDGGARETTTDVTVPNAGMPVRRTPNRRRRKLLDQLEEWRASGEGLSGTTDLMISTGDEHRLRFSGGPLGEHGGPLDKVVDLLSGLKGLIGSVLPSAGPELATVQSLASLDVVIRVPDEEQAPVASQAPVNDSERTDLLSSLVDADDRDGTGDGALTSLPDTTLALAVISEILSQEPQEAVTAARTVSVETADKLRAFAFEMWDQDVTLSAPSPNQRETSAILAPSAAQEIVERVDAHQSLPSRSVRVIGLLQGANSGGAGQFEIKTDEHLPFDRALGAKLKPGDAIRGVLSPRARRQIREGSLWDTEVEGRVKVVRRQQGRSVRVETRELTSVKARGSK